MINTKHLAYLGFVVPLLFWSTIILCGLMTKNYSHLTNLVSELGAQQTSTQYLFTSGLVLCSVLSIIFIFALLKTAKKKRLNPIPVFLLLTFSIPLFGAAVFPLPLSLHGILGSPSMLLPLSPLLALILWNNDKIPNIKIAATIVLAIMLLGFLTFTPLILDNYFGLKQRFFHMGWSLWFVFLGQSFMQMEKEISPKIISQSS